MTAIARTAARLEGLYRRVAGGPGQPGMWARLSFLTVFVGAKVIALVGMLWLASVADPTVFGGVELALAASLIVAGVGLLGIPGGVTRLALALDEPHVADHLAFAALCIAAPSTLLAITGLAFGAPASAVLIVASCAVACVQAIGTTYARIRARPMLNSVVDPMAVLSILAISAVLWLVGSLTLQALAWSTTIFAGGLTALLVIGFLRVRRPGFSQSYRRALKLSLPILAFSGVAMMVGAGLRPLLGVRFSLEELALYSLGFRLCAPCMLLHQMLVTAFFARVYMAADRTFDRIVAALLAVCTICVFGVWVVLPLIVPVLFPAYAARLDGMGVLFPLIGLQVVLWILIAQLEMKVGRHAVAAVSAFAGYIIFGLFALCFAGLPLTALTQATGMFDIALGVFALAQLLLLHRKGVTLPLSGVAMALSAVAAVVMMRFAS